MEQHAHVLPSVIAQVEACSGIVDERGVIVETRSIRHERTIRAERLLLDRARRRLLGRRALGDTAIDHGWGPVSNAMLRAKGEANLQSRREADLGVLGFLGVLGAVRELSTSARSPVSTSCFSTAASFLILRRRFSSVSYVVP